MCSNLIDVWTNIKEATRIRTIELADTQNNIVTVPDHVDNFLPAIGDQNLHSLPELIKLMAVGIFLAFIRSDIKQMGFNTNIGPICSELLDFTVKKFRDTIWKPRCKRNAERERNLGITSADKRSYPNKILSNIRHRTAASMDPSYYHTLLERWKANHTAELNAINIYINREYYGLNYGWATTRAHIHNWNRLFSWSKDDDNAGQTDTPE